MDLSITLGKGKLPNPVGVASGTFGYGSEYEFLIDLNALGALFTKAITLESRPGNDIPRIVETPSGILNSIGLANVGVERFISEKIPYLSSLKCAVIGNIAGSTEDEYCQIIERLEPYDGLMGYEINISCPNVHQGGMAFGTDPLGVEKLTRQLRAITEKPLIVKLTPNVTDITVIAKAAENGGADGVSCINTLVGMVIDVNRKCTVLPRGSGGLSGPAIRPVGVAMTWRVCRAVSIPVIGIGGIMNTDDALQYLLAGASAVQIGTANFIDPDTVVTVIQGIKEYLGQEKLTCIKDLHHLLS